MTKELRNSMILCAVFQNAPAEVKTYTTPTIPFRCLRAVLLPVLVMLLKPVLMSPHARVWSETVNLNDQGIEDLNKSTSNIGFRRSGITCDMTSCQKKRKEGRPTAAVLVARLEAMIPTSLIVSTIRTLFSFASEYSLSFGASSSAAVRERSASQPKGDLSSPCRTHELVD